MINYNIYLLVNNGYIYVNIHKGMNVLPQAGRISHDHLQKHLAKYNYLTDPITSVLWSHNTQSINFTLVVDGFEVKKLGQEHTKHFKNSLKSLYNITTYWEGKLCISITL